MITLSKYKNLWVLFPLLLPVAQSSFAADVDETLELKVVGKITPSSCTLTLGTDNGIAGELKYTNIESTIGGTSSSNSVSLGTLTLPSAVTLNCEGATLIGVATTDNRSATVNTIVNVGSASPSEIYTYNADGTNAGKSSDSRLLGLGVDAKNNKIGAYSGTFINLLVEGAKAKFSTCMNESTFTGATIEQGGALVVGACPAGQSHQVLDSANKSLTGNVFVWDYIIDSSVAPEANLDPAGWKLDGSVTVQINYL